MIQQAGSMKTPLQSSLLVIINPVIAYVSTIVSTAAEECPCLPGFNGQVERVEEVCVDYLSTGDVSHPITYLYYLWLKWHCLFD